MFCGVLGATVFFKFLGFIGLIGLGEILRVAGMTSTTTTAYNAPMTNKDLTVAEVAKRLKFSGQTVRRILAEGKFPHAYQMNPGAATSPFLIPESDVDAFERSRKRPFGVKSISSRAVR